MKSFAPLMLVSASLLLAGCATHKSSFGATSGPSHGGRAAAAVPQPIVTPDASLAATVVSYNDTGRFVVLNFPVGQMPKMGQSLFLYRNGLKVAEVKVSNWQRDNFIVADLVTGNAQAGDEVRDQ